MKGVILAVLAALIPLSVSAQEEAQRWRSNVIRDRLDNSTETQVYTVSNDTIHHSPRRPSEPGLPAELVIACQRGRMFVFVEFPGRLIAGSTSVVDYRIGSQPPVRRARGWQPKVERTGAGIWNARAAIPFVRQLMRSENVFIRFTDDVFGTSEATFQIGGLDASIGPVRAACNW